MQHTEILTLLPVGICYTLIGVRDLPWVRGGWGLDALGKFFCRRRRRRRPPGVGGGRREFGFSRNQITKMRPQAHFCDLIS